MMTEKLSWRPSTLRLPRDVLEEIEKIAKEFKVYKTTVLQWVLDAVLTDKEALRRLLNGKLNGK